MEATHPIDSHTFIHSHAHLYTHTYSNSHTLTILTQLSRRTTVRPSQRHRVGSRHQAVLAILTKAAVRLPASFRSGSLHPVQSHCASALLGISFVSSSHS